MQLRVKAPYMRHVLHVWLAQVPKFEAIADSWSRAQFWFDASLGIHRLVPTSTARSAGAISVRLYISARVYVRCVVVTGRWHQARGCANTRHRDRLSS